ncbi:MAG: hypothetical protein IJ519_02745 [Clostridia bacterium]|nr:hypothetical protein [Clostridia bacterium]
MDLLNCECKKDCTAWALLAGIIIGIITAFLRITGVVTPPTAALIAAFGIAVGALVLTLLALAIGVPCGSRCISTAVDAILLGALGTLLLSVVLLAIEFETTSIIGAILTGALAALFTLIFGGVACLIRCFVRNCN